MYDVETNDIDLMDHSEHTSNDGLLIPQESSNSLSTSLSEQHLHVHAHGIASVLIDNNNSKIESPLSNINPRKTRTYTAEQRLNLLSQAADSVSNEGISLRLAAERYGLAKSSLSDYLKKRGIAVNHRNSSFHRSATKRSSSTSIQKDNNYESSIDSVTNNKTSHLPTQVPFSKIHFVSDKSKHCTKARKNSDKKKPLFQESSSSIDLLGVPLSNTLFFQSYQQQQQPVSSSTISSMASTILRAQALCDFINRSPSPFHVVKECRGLLRQANFQELREKDEWNLKPSGLYFTTRNSSSLIALAVGGRWQPGNGFSIIGAHTDSPCLKLKPVSKKSSCGYVQLGVQPYGGGLWFTWFDRDLTLAGRVVVRDGNSLSERLVHIKQPILRVPSLAIHLDRTVQDALKINKETHLSPVLCTAIEEKVNETSSDNNSRDSNKNIHGSELLQLLSEELHVSVENIVDIELCVVDTQPAQLGGTRSEFVFAPRLDNQLSCFSGIQALLETPGLEEDTHCRVLCLYDNEEVGSVSAQGAESMLTEMVLRRACAPGSVCSFEQSIAKSVLLSVDQAHAVHPNYEDKHEKNHKVKIHGGMVLKHNTNQRYATNSRTASYLRECAHRAGDLPLQEFVVRQDSLCGSTIGPILSAKLGISTLDIGSPQLSMHSCREMGSAPGVNQSVSMLQAFYQHLSSVLESYDECSSDQ